MLEKDLSRSGAEDTLSKGSSSLTESVQVDRVSSACTRLLWQYSHLGAQTSYVFFQVSPSYSSSYNIDCTEKMSRLRSQKRLASSVRIHTGLAPIEEWQAVDVDIDRS